MKIIDGKNMVLGRLASYVAKEALKGEDISIINCEEIVITGNKQNIRAELQEKRGRVGSTEKGPKVSRTSEKIVKRAIRGMLPNYRTGRGRVAFKRIKCYVGTPKEFENEKKVYIEREKTQGKLMRIKDVSK
jgi:large subunit ribosomal protein L13